MALRLSSSNLDNATAPPRSKKTVEQTFTKLTQLEHVLLRPDTYIGSTERIQQSSWVWDDDTRRMVHKDISFSPGLYKIFDELLVNAADHSQRDKSMNSIKVEIDPENQLISVWNNGSGIPVEMHKKEKVYVPELIFGHLLTSSNYDDNEKKVVGGRNGYGAKLANIFSTEFTVETADAINGKRYKQTFRNNMSSKDEPTIRANPKNEAFTKISFSPDLSRFGMQYLDNDVVSLLKKRVYDIAGINSSLKVHLNGSKINIKSFKDYVELYPSDPTSQIVHERISDRWEVAITASDGQLNQVSFVNSIWTIKGGTHVGHVADAIVAKVAEHITKKHKGMTVKPFQIKNHLSLYINCLVENPAFDSQTKETLTTKPSKFGSKWTFSEDLAKKALSKTMIVENVLAFARFKQSKELAKTDGGKKARVVGIPKLDDANKAGSREATKCTLILTEGDSAKALAVSGLSVVGRDYYGVFPLRGKLLNVREAKHKQIMDNAEINNLKKILGLQHNKKYDGDSVKSLRYGHVLIMADQDHDGSHIKGLVINFFDHFWPSLLQVDGFIQEFITPIVKCVKGRQDKVFFTIPQYKEWVQSEGGQAGWRAKYYKGLGTSTAAEAKTYFSNLPRHLLEFFHRGDDDTDSLELAFSKQRINDRKEWLSGFVPGTYFDHGRDELNYSNFVNKELILFSVADNARSIPSIIDGLKPSQRKVLYACFKRKLSKNEIKVVQLAGYVSEHAAYHHGEMSLQATIVGLAQNFVGSNNVNLLVPAGQFGTRLQGGKDAASSRYIFTKLSPVTRALIPEVDDPLLSYLEEDGMSIEPEWYCPVIPLVLINGSDGIGTGWSSSVPCYNPRDLIKNIRHLLNEEAMEPMMPWYRGFNGTIVPVENANGFDVYGTVKHGSEPNTVRIEELPIRSWTTPYKEFLEANVVGVPDAKHPFIRELQDNSTENNVRFTITASSEVSDELRSSHAYKRLKLVSSLSTNNMVLFDAEGRIRKYDSPEDIVAEFFKIRLSMYDRRREHLLRELEQELLCLDNKQRFILMVIDGKLKVAKRKKVDLMKDLKRLKFDPVFKKKALGRESPEDKEEGEEEETEVDIREADSGYDYLLSLPLWSLTAERVEQLRRQRDNKALQKEEMEHKTGKALWESDLVALEAVLSKDEAAAEKMSAELEKVSREALKKQRGRGGKRGKAAKTVVYDEQSGEDDFEALPVPSARVVVVKAPRQKKDAKAKESRRPKQATQPASKPKAALMRQLDSDSDFAEDFEDDQDDAIVLGSDGDGVVSDDVEEVMPTRVNRSKRAAAKQAVPNSPDVLNPEMDEATRLDTELDDQSMDSMPSQRLATKLEFDGTAEPQAVEKPMRGRKKKSVTAPPVSDTGIVEDIVDDLDSLTPIMKKPILSRAAIAAAAAVAGKAKRKSASESEDSDFEEVIKKTTRSKRGTRSRKTNVPEENDEIEAENSQPTRIATKRARPGKKLIESIEESEDEAGLQAARTGRAMRAPAGASNKVISLDSDADGSDAEGLSLSQRLAQRLVVDVSKSRQTATTKKASRAPAANKVSNAVKRKGVARTKKVANPIALVISPGPSPKPKKSRVKSPEKEAQPVSNSTGKSAVVSSAVPARGRPRRAAVHKKVIESDSDDAESEEVDDDDFIVDDSE